MKVLFITDNVVVENLGIGYLSSYAKKAGHKVDFIQTKKEDLEDKILCYEPNVLAYSVTTGKHNFFRKLDSEIKKWYKAQSVFGGPHITFFPKFIQGDDIGIRGEGFEAFPELLDRLENKQSIETMDNIVLEGLINPLRPLLDKTTLLRPDRHLMYSYFDNYNNPIKNVMCSFFCPYSCPYCYSKKYKEMYGIKSAEIRPVNDIIEEINKLKLYPLKMIFFQDDIFPIYRDKWLDEFCAEYEKIGIPFHIQVRAEMITNDIIKKLKPVGLHGVTFAIESGNLDLRMGLLKRKMSNSLIINAADILHQNGIRLRTENMIGIPHETYDTAMETLRLNIECKPDIAWASLYQPYPGTDLGNQCIEEKLFDGDMDELADNFFDTYRLKSRYSTQFTRLQKIFSLIVMFPFLSYFTRILTSLPFDSLYKKVYKIVKLYLYQRRLFRCG
jgi:radical SAM superfamily enzyme YgiQ (UPF0313 family)